jgi:hypothetical protein
MPNPKRLIRPKEAWTRMGIGHTKFYEDYINTGRLRLLQLGPKSTALFEHDLEQVMAELPEAPRGPAIRRRRRS